jgi:hypothetical protein
MLKRTSKQALECYRHAADCRERAKSANDPQMRKFWQQQENAWTDIATSYDFSERIAEFLQSVECAPRPVSREVDWRGVETLLAIYKRTCDALNLDLEDETLLRTIAQTIIEDALDGERDPNMLYRRAVEAVSKH